MIITVKNLQQQTFTVEFEPEKRVLQLKEKIFVERGSEYVVEKQKLIYAGVILDDDRTIASYNVDENKFIVVLLKRDIGGAQKSVETGVSTSRSVTSIGPAGSGSIIGSTSSTGSDEIKKSTVDRTSNKVEKTGADEKPFGNETTGCGALSTPVTSHTSLQSTTSNLPSESVQGTFSSVDLAGVISDTFQSRAESNLLMGEEYNRSVESMIEMGYSRELVVRAMTASFNNPERAVEYLVSGIPEANEGLNASAASEERPSAGNNVPADGGVEGTADDSVVIPFEPDQMMEIPPGADPFEFLRNQPQFLQMRSLVYQNPDLLHAVLQQIGQTNPALLQLISENQDAFLNMLNEPIDDLPEAGRRNRRSPRRHAQLAAAALASASGDSSNVGPLDTNPGTGGNIPTDGLIVVGSSDSVRDSLPHDLLPPRSDRAAQLRAAAADTFMQERGASADNVTSPATVTVDRNVSGSGDRSIGEGLGVRSTTPLRNMAPTATGTDGTTTIRLTPGDQEAIERLKALGFPEFLVLQAYFACDKDEQLAANFLISSAYDD